MWSLSASWQLICGTPSAEVMREHHRKKSDRLLTVTVRGALWLEEFGMSETAHISIVLLSGVCAT